MTTDPKLSEVEQAIADACEHERLERTAALRPIRKSAENLKQWIAVNAPNVGAEQRHLDEGTPERAYWHYGYATALQDALALIPAADQSLLDAHDKEVRERAAQLVQDEMGHDPDCPWFYSLETAHVENCTCEAKELADKVRALKGSNDPK